MNYIVFIFLLCMNVIGAYADDLASEQPQSAFLYWNFVNQNYHRQYGHHASVVFGDGVAEEGGSMNWRTFELRIGSCALPDNHFDFVHYNEGHPDNNHRDGFAVQAMHDLPLNQNIIVEVGLGPYVSYNTTTQNAIQYDEKHLGILVSAILLYYFKSKNDHNVHLRAELNHVTMPNAHDSDAILIGIGFDFGTPDYLKTPTDPARERLQIALMGANFKTNRSHTQSATGGQVELKQYEGNTWAYSLSLIQEGDDALVERGGAALQVWYVWPVSEDWTLSAGAGPYIAENRLKGYEKDLDGLISLDVQMAHLLMRFSRVMTDDSTDRDMFSIGLAKKF